MIELDNIFQRYIHYLMLNTSKISDIGLMNGKMGIVLFFKYYSRYLHMPIYADYADYILGEIYESISVQTPIGFESGISGIGWGIEYLLENEYLEGNSNYVLEDLDKRIMQYNILRLDDLSLNTGIEGISYYITKRINSSIINNSSLPFDASYLNDWKSVWGNVVPSDSQILSNMITNVKLDDKIINCKLGLLQGCAGWCLQKIFCN